VMPFEEGFEAEMSNSVNIGVKRLYNLEKTFRKDKGYKTKYILFINKLMHKNFLYYVKDLDIKEDQTGKLYIPHHGVYKKSDNVAKSRVVFDASCSEKDK
jgi:hypothetical protein